MANNGSNLMKFIGSFATAYAVSYAVTRMVENAQDKGKQEQLENNVRSVIRGMNQTQTVPYDNRTRY